MTMTTDALRSQEAISQEKLQETFLNMTDADPYFGYKVMSAEIKRVRRKWASLLVYSNL